MPMIKDPIIREVREIRDDIAKSYGYDVDAIVAGLQKQSIASGRKTISLPPKLLSDDANGSAGGTERIQDRIDAASADEVLDRIQVGEEKVRPLEAVLKKLGL